MRVAGGNARWSDVRRLGASTGWVPRAAHRVQPGTRSRATVGALASHAWARCVQLSGTIPECFGAGEYLKTLVLSDNFLVGHLPKSLGNLSGLGVL